MFEHIKKKIVKGLIEEIFCLDATEKSVSADWALIHEPPALLPLHLSPG